MNRKVLTGVISAVGLAVVLALVFFVIFPLGAEGKLPFQSHPTAIPVTPFANLSSPASASTTVSAGATSAPAATPSVAATTGSAPATASATTVPTAASAASAVSPTSVAASAPSGTFTATTGGTTFTVVGDQSQAQVTVNEKLAQLPTNSDAVLKTTAMQGQIVLGPDTKPTDASQIQVDLRTLKSDS